MGLVIGFGGGAHYGSISPGPGPQPPLGPVEIEIRLGYRSALNTDFDGGWDNVEYALPLAILSDDVYGERGLINTENLYISIDNYTGDFGSWDENTTFTIQCSDVDENVKFDHFNINYVDDNDNIIHLFNIINNGSLFNIKDLMAGLGGLESGLRYRFNIHCYITDYYKYGSEFNNLNYSFNDNVSYNYGNVEYVHQLGDLYFYDNDGNANDDIKVWTTKAFTTPYETPKVMYGIFKMAHNDMPFLVGPEAEGKHNILNTYIIDVTDIDNPVIVGQDWGETFRTSTWNVFSSDAVETFGRFIAHPNHNYVIQVQGTHKVLSNNVWCNFSTPIVTFENPEDIIRYGGQALLTDIDWSWTDPETLPVNIEEDVPGKVELEINLEFAGAFDEGWNDARYGTAVLSNTVTGDGLECVGERVTYDNYSGNYDGMLDINQTLMLAVNGIPEGYELDHIEVNWANRLNGIGISQGQPYYFNIAGLLAENGVDINNDEHYQIDIYVYIKEAGTGRNTDNMTHVFIGTADPDGQLTEMGDVPVYADFTEFDEQVYERPCSPWTEINWENYQYNSSETALWIKWSTQNNSNGYTRQNWAVCAFYDDMDATGNNDETYWQTLAAAAIERGDLIGITYFDASTGDLQFSNIEDIMQWLNVDDPGEDMFNHDLPRVDVDTIDYSRHINIVIVCTVEQN